MNSRAAISWFVAPSAARREICASWGVRSSRVETPILAPQPFAVEETGPGELGAAPCPLEPLDRLAVERLGGFPFRHQRPGTGLDAKSPIGAAGRGCLRQPSEGVGCELGFSAPGGRLDQLDQPKC